MVKRYELGSEWWGGDDAITTMVEDPTGDYVLHEDYAKALALIAEMKGTVFTAAGHYPFDADSEFLELMALVARAEELLRD